MTPDEARQGKPVTHSATVQTYSSAWSQATEHGIREALALCWTPASTYTDPMTPTVTGPDELAAAILNLHASSPGALLVQTSQLDMHHAVGRFAWQLKSPTRIDSDGTARALDLEGLDYVEFSEDGSRILKIVGFFGPLRAK
jgi:hypothetical protein